MTDNVISLMPGSQWPAMAAAALMLAGQLACGAAFAQGVTDPTRPPAAEAVSPDGNAGSGLQSVLISDNRKAAVIGGQVVELGQKYGDATLVRVTENEVTLERGHEKQVLRLFPGIEKKMVMAAAPESAPANAGKKKSKSRGSK